MNSSAPTDAALDALVELLDGSDSQAQARATRALLDAGAAGRAAVVRGLQHGRPAVRRWCADFFDHHGDDACVADLQGALADPVPKVRRAAIHSLGCDRCKGRPLTVDVVETLIRFAHEDPSVRVRREAAYQLGEHGSDPRALSALHALLASSPDRWTRGVVHGALRAHDAAYRARTDAEARARPAARDAAEGAS